MPTIYEGESKAVARSIIYSIANDPKTAFAQTQSLYDYPPFQKTLECSAKWIDYCDHYSNDPESSRYEKCDKEAWRQKDGDACYESMFGSDYIFVNNSAIFRTVSFANALAYYQLGDLENAYVHINTARKLSYRTYDLRSYLLTVLIYEALNRPIPYGLPTSLDTAIQHLERNIERWPDREKRRFQIWSHYFFSIRRPPNTSHAPMASANLPKATVDQNDEVSELVRNYVLGEADAARKKQDQRERLVEKYVTGTEEKQDQVIDNDTESEPEDSVDVQESPHSIVFYAFIPLLIVLFLFAGILFVRRPSPGYLNTSYRIAAWCWTLGWLALSLPFLYVGWQAASNFRTFSWAGLQESLYGAGEALRTILIAWFAFWFTTVAILFLAWLIAKLYGRYSLPTSERPRIRPMYATARLCFFALSIMTMYYSVTRISHHVDNIVETGLLREPEKTPAGETQVQTTLFSAVTQAAARRNFDKEITDALNRDDITHAEIYIGLADWLNIEVSPHVRVRYQETQGFWNWMTRSATNCVKGGILRSTENLAQIVCIVGAEFALPLYADVADIVRQTVINPLTGQKTDPFIVIGAAVGRIFDRRVRMFEQASSARHLRHAANKGGLTAAVMAARYADNVAELRFAGRIANQFEKRTAGVLHLLGKRTFGLFKHYRIAKVVQLAMGGWAGLWALAITMLLSTLFSVVRSRVFRFFTLRWLRRIDERRIAQHA